MRSQKYLWVKTEERGKYGAIYHNLQTGEIAEDIDGFLVTQSAVPLTARSAGSSCYLLGQDRLAVGQSL
jgi:hypothetical protein